MIRLTLAITVLATLLAPGAVAAAAKKGDACKTGETCADIACHKARTLCLLEAGDPGLAVELLRKDGEKLGGERTWTLLLARAYLDQGNSWWAINVLDAWLALHPDDCVARSWMAWARIVEADWKEAAAALDAPACREEGGGAIAARFALLEAFMTLQKGKAGAAAEPGAPATAAKKKKTKIAKLFEEDIDLLRHVRAEADPAWSPPVIVKAEIKGGYATNALFGSPGDPVNTDKETGSPLLGIDLLGSWSPVFQERFTHLIELSMKSLVFFARDARSLSYLDGILRTGVTVHSAHGGWPRLFLGYKGDLLFLNMGDKYDDAPVAFYEGHRGELELSLIPSVILYAGGGKRFFREKIRTRWELDGGIAFQAQLWGRLTVTGALALRKYWAESKAYGIAGVSGLLGGTIDLGRGTGLKAVLFLSTVNYGDSRGYFAPGETRRDTAFRAIVELMTPSWQGVRVSCLYEFSRKFSTVPAFAFTDHRVSLKLTFARGFDFLSLKKAAAPKDHVPLDYGLSPGGSGVASRIQDMLHEDEYIRGGASCGCKE